MIVSYWQEGFSFNWASFIFNVNANVNFHQELNHYFFDYERLTTKNAIILFFIL
jgi:hypothetical protein